MKANAIYNGSFNQSNLQVIFLVAQQGFDKQSREFSDCITGVNKKFK